MSNHVREMGGHDELVGGMSNYFDLNPEAVGGAGRRTAATAQDWDAWARRWDAGMRNVAAGAMDPVVRGAFEEYLSTSNPLIQGLATAAEAQGRNATSAADTMVGADQQSAGTLNQAAAEALRVNSLLSRPING